MEMHTLASEGAYNPDEIAVSGTAAQPTSSQRENLPDPVGHRQQYDAWHRSLTQRMD